MTQLFPRRRSEDKTDHSAIGRLLTFTDLMALLLCFFIMLYATRDPDARQMQAFAPNIAPVVIPVDSEMTKGPNPQTLAKPGIGLDLNYIAGLLRQAAARDDALAGITLTTHEHALAVTIPGRDLKILQRVLDRVSAYRRTIEVFVPEPLLAPLLARPGDSGIRYFPQDSRDRPVILIH